MIERLLRSTAVAIAVAALVDPPLALTTRLRPRLAITLERPSDPVALGVADRLGRDLRSDFDVVSSGPDRDALAAVVIGDRYPDHTMGFPQRTSTVTVDAGPRGATARIASVRAPRAVPRGTRIHVAVTLEAVTANPALPLVTISAGEVGHPDVEVARASHAWAAGARRVALPLEAMPLGLPPWHLRVRVSDAGQSSSVATSDVLVEEAAPRRVLFYEPRPSWIATFVRRALERDERFAVSGLNYPSRGIRIASGDAVSLDPSALREVAAVIVGGLDRLTAADRDRLDRFVRERGGSLVLLPDGRPGSAPWTEWLPGVSSREVLLERPSALAVTPPLPTIHVSELVTFAGARVSGSTVPGVRVPGAKVLARVAGSDEPVVTIMPHGAGRLLVSGALDAWRYRAENGSEFDRFWRSAIAGVALETPAPVDVELMPAIAHPGESVRVVARIHRSALGFAPTDPLLVSARVDSGEPVRLWPEAEADVFSGSFAASQAGVQRVTVSARTSESGGAAGAALVAVDSTARRAEPVVPLALLATSHGGIDVTPDHLADLEAYLRTEIPASPLTSTSHPMRFGWWIVPFAACLSGEWWLRRRRGLR